MTLAPETIGSASSSAIAEVLEALTPLDLAWPVELQYSVYFKYVQELVGRAVTSGKPADIEELWVHCVPYERHGSEPGKLDMKAPRLSRMEEAGKKNWRPSPTPC